MMIRLPMMLTIMGTMLSTAVHAADSPPNLTPQDINALATNVDKAVQACSIHVSTFVATKGEALIRAGLRPSQDAPSAVRDLAVPGSFGASLFYRWPETRAEVWLIASREKASCRVAVSGSGRVGQIGPRLNALVQVGKYWRPAKPGEIPAPPPSANGPLQTVFVMDVPAKASFLPAMVISSVRPGMAPLSGQQMVITVMVFSKG